MPTNAVYQPTTVTFETTSGPFPPQTSTTTSRLKAIFRKPWAKIALLFGGLFFVALGIILFSCSFADFEDTIKNEDTVTEIPVQEKEFDIAFMVLGVFFFLFGLFLLGEQSN